MHWERALVNFKVSALLVNDHKSLCLLLTLSQRYRCYKELFEWLS